MFDRMPCSHAIAVALDRQDDPLALVHSVYTKEGWAAQMAGGFNPVLGIHTWPTVSWSLRPDDSRMVYHDGPGRKRVNRMRSTMDYTQRSSRRGRSRVR